MENPIPITLIIGKYDKMVPGKSLEKFSTKIPKLHKIILPIGNGGLIESIVKFFQKNKTSR